MEHAHKSPVTNCVCCRYTHSPSVDRVTPNVGAILPGVSAESRILPGIVLCMLIRYHPSCSRNFVYRFMHRNDALQVTQEVYVDIYGMVMESRGTGYKAGYVAGSLMAAQKAGTASMQQSSCCWVQVRC